MPSDRRKSLSQETISFNNNRMLSNMRLLKEIVSFEIFDTLKLIRRAYQYRRYS